MRNLAPHLGLAVTLALGSTTLGAPAISSGMQTPSDEAILGDFAARVQVYVEIHRCLEGPSGRMPMAQEWSEIYAAIQTLAADIRDARRDARQGDVFAPGIDALFRRIVREALANVDPEELVESLNAENPPGLVLVPHINGRWPEDAPLGSMPVKLLAALPLLPDDLQYRFMGRDLVLWDSHANVIVDYMKDVIPRRTLTRVA